MASTLNYTEQGGAKTIIGGELLVKGKLILDPDAKIEGLFKIENQEPSDATTVAALREDLNTLLISLKNSGLMSSND